MSMMGSDGLSQIESTMSVESGSTGSPYGSVSSELSLTSPSDHEVAQWAAMNPQVKPGDRLASQEFNTETEELDEGDGDANDGSFQNMWIDNKTNNTDSLSSSANTGSFGPFAPNIFPTIWNNRFSVSNPVSTHKDTPLITYDNAQLGHNSEKEFLAKNGPQLAALSSVGASEPAKKGKTILTVENLDSDTRSKILDLLCQRKIVVTIEIV